MKNDNKIPLILNSIQKAAIECQNSSILVLAGPGSGKTLVLTSKIAKILTNSEDQNFRVLGLTFTNDAANEMRVRLNELVPNQMDRVFLGTYHSFCANVLRQHGNHIGIKSNFQIYSQDSDLKSVISSAMKEEKIITRLNLNRILNMIRILKEKLVLPENAQGYFNGSIGNEIPIIYSAYEKKLNENNALDFNSLILKTFQLFNKFPAFVKNYQTIYPYICVDEFQDTNFAPYALLKLIAGKENKNLFIVADDDQLIYQWNGASPNRIKNFIKHYSPKIFQLPVNYRCPPEIVDLANNLIKNNFSRLENKQPIKASKKRSDNSNIMLFDDFKDLEAESEGISQDIIQKHQDNLNSVVIIGRNRKILENFQKSLHNKGIDAKISQRKDEFESTPLIWVHNVLKLINNQNLDVLDAVCGSFQQFTNIKIDPETVIAKSQTSEIGYLQHWIKLVQEEDLNEYQNELIKKTLNYLGKGKDFQGFSDYALDWFDSFILRERKLIADYENEIFSSFEEEKLVWKELISDISFSLGNGITLEAFLQELQMHSKEPAYDNDTLVLMTIHGSKGREFDHVYLVGLVEGELPSFQSIRKGNGSPEMEEERRNCFVAITRTVETLTLSYARNYYGWKKHPSRFIHEMGLINESK